MRQRFWGIFVGVVLAWMGGASLVRSGQEVHVGDPESARRAVRDAKPGDTVVLAKGEWKDVDLRFDGEGSKEAPITIRAEVPGETIITGASRIRLGGEYLVVSGLWLKNLTGEAGDLFQFRIDSKRRANHCRVSDCAFTEDADFAGAKKPNRWIGIFGEGNQLDHCRIEGKKNVGATVVVWLGESDPGRHRIWANYFGERPPLGENGGESIRIGDSNTSMQTAACLVEGNVFDRCDGEVECISNKSCGNIYRGNFFIETQGTLTLRHGNDCLVEGNYFFGEKRRSTGGIRIIGEGHRIVGNVLKDLEGIDYRAAISVVNGIPRSPAYGYLQVKNVIIEDNLLINCKEPLLLGYSNNQEATLPPQGLKIRGNRIQARSKRPAIRVDLLPTAMEWADNLVEGDLQGLAIPEGIVRGKVNESAFPPVPGKGEVGISWDHKIN